jgi:hypothetical protein
MGTFASSSNDDDDDDDDGDNNNNNLSYESHLNFRDVPTNTVFSLLLISSSALLVKC